MADMQQQRIRNFSIIAHIDHGKTTLSDRLLERTGALSQREMTEQFLDSMDLERERGITIKQHSVRLEYKAKDGHDYILNLIDTPGHVDFAYEVSRSLAACQGALLVVDASQGVEAQTLANAHLASDAGLEIIPVLNKIDLPGAEPERAKEQIEHVIGIDASGAIPASAKMGVGIDEILEAIVRRVPPPKGDPDGPFRGLVFDSWFDQYRGVVVLVHVVDGRLEPGMKVRLMASGGTHEVEQLGVFTPKPVPVDSLAAGEVGFVIAGIKRVSDVAIGDTLIDDRKPAKEPLPGFKEIKPMVFAGLYPVDADQYAELRDALEKLRLNDSSFFYEPETSAALGFGFRCGFLGLLHMEIVQERRDPARLLRQAEVGLARLCLSRLRDHRALGVAAGQAGRARERRAGGCPVADRSPVDGVPARQAARREAAEDDPEADVRGGDPGRDRLARHRPRDGDAAAQERHRQVLRWRHLAQAEAAREAEGRQEADEAGRHRGHPAGGLPGRAARRRLGATTRFHPVRTHSCRRCRRRPQ